MKLVIVESPTKAKTLSGILGKDYEVKASMGHIRDLPKKGLGVDVEHNYEPEYEIPAKSKKTATELKKLSLDAESVILATDLDREGEAIAWHLQYILSSAKKPKGKKPITFGRVTFHEITKDAVLKAFSHQTEVNLNLVDAQQARRVLDRLVGYKLSPLLWKKVRYGLSAGRVQSVAVRLIVERERERQAFRPKEYWTLEGKFETPKKDIFLAQLFEYQKKKIEIKNENQAIKIKADLEADEFKISKIEKTERKRNPYPPYKTSTLQQSAANIFGFTAKRTMSTAQKLFENGYITYHRTDSFNLSPKFITEARSFLKTAIGAKFLPENPNYYKNNSKGAQEAHEAIRPTILDLSKTSHLAGDEAKIYSLIWKRSLECQMLSAVYDQTTVFVESQKSYVFKVVGSKVLFEGWLSVSRYMGAQNEEEEEAEVEFSIDGLKKLPSLAENDILNMLELLSDQHFTQPPPRYTDATLIKTLEELGIGRPSTYAPTISTIEGRGYVHKDGRAFVPEDVAYVVIDLLVANFKNIVDYEFTAGMEENLDKIAEGKVKWVPIIDAFYKPFEKNVLEKEKELSKADVTKLGESDEKCPKCGKILYIKLGKYGKFLSCSGFPECEFAKPMDGEGVDDSGDPIEFGVCDVCKTGKMILRKGRFGKFLACNNYPKCKTTKPYLDKIGMKCPTCADGEIVVKKAKRRVFYGCSNYPDCKYSSWKDPRTKSEAE